MSAIDLRIVNIHRANDEIGQPPTGWVLKTKDDKITSEVYTSALDALEVSELGKMLDDLEYNLYASSDDAKLIVREYRERGARFYAAGVGAGKCYHAEMLRGWWQACAADRNVEHYFIGDFDIDAIVESVFLDAETLAAVVA